MGFRRGFKQRRTVVLYAAPSGCMYTCLPLFVDIQGTCHSSPLEKSAYDESPMVSEEGTLLSQQDAIIDDQLHMMKEQEELKRLFSCILEELMQELQKRANRQPGFDKKFNVDATPAYEFGESPQGSTNAALARRLQQSMQTDTGRAEDGFVKQQIQAKVSCKAKVSRSLKPGTRLQQPRAVY